MTTGRCASLTQREKADEGLWKGEGDLVSAGRDVVE